VNPAKRMTRSLMSGTSLLSFLAVAAAPAYAQQQPAPQVAQAELEEVVVTGSRLVSSGFETPTPVTVVTAETLANSMPSNIADSLRQIPALGSTLSSNQTGSGTGAAGNNGQANLNLRNLGTNRNLVLLDGRRTVSSNVNNSVDINTLPQNLVSRVDVVTGGASAAYGSDALAGVVNFVLDTNFVGVKGDIGGGISDYGDLASWKGSLAWGGAFAHDKLHIIASTAYSKQLGTEVNQPTGRDWWDKPYGLISNTTGKGPTNLVLPNILSSIGTYGGLITNTILKGTQFLANGQVAPFNYGYSSGTQWQSGGDGAWIPYNFSPTQWRTANFVHATYEINDDVTIYAEAAFSYARVLDHNQKPINQGSGNQYTIYAGNPFIPASVAAVMSANKITSFTMGRYMLDYPDVDILTGTRVARQVIGGKGRIGDSWKWEASYSNGDTNQLLAQKNLTKARETYAAADAVINPNTGQIVCRSQYYNAAGAFVPGGTGMDAGCKPQNLFGTNTVDPSTMGWTIGDSWKRFKLRQQVAAVTLSGDLGEFRLDAGPIAVATGAEYRHEHGNATTDNISVQTIDFTGVRGGPAALAGRLGPFRFANFQPFGGSYSVKEGFGEIGIPLLKGLPLAQALNIDLAARVTDYTTSGTVVTWKAGVDYQVIPDIRLRGTVSRDIRAPSLLELYNGATFNSNAAFYPATGLGPSTTTVVITSGNPALVPEKALTQTYGVVLTPTFLDGFKASIDYYNIKIDGGIQTVATQNIIDNCYNNIPGFCDLVQVVGGTVRVRSPFLNLSVVKSAGFDFAADYRTSLFDNPLTLGVTAQRLTAAYTQPVAAAAIPTLGGNNDPKWRVNLRANYDVGDWNFFVQERYIGPKLVDAQRVEGVFVDDNTVSKVFYTDMTITYSLEALGSRNQIYLTVNNLTNQNPPKDIGPPSSFEQPGNRTVYDWIGRYYSLGVRFKF
jgi:iron complex outermembrane receptor protein